MLLEIIFWVCTAIAAFTPAIPETFRPYPLVVAVVCLGLKVFGT